MNLDHNLLGAAPERSDGLAQLGDLPCLARLSMSHNRLSDINNLPPCRALAELSVADNAICDLQSLTAVLASQPALTTLVLHGNSALTHLPSRGNTSSNNPEHNDELPPDLARYFIINSCLHLQRLVTFLPTEVEGGAHVKLGSLSTLAPAAPTDSTGTALQAAGVSKKGGSKPPAPPSGFAVTPSEVTGAHISGSPHHPDTVPSAGSKDAHIAELLAPVPRGSPVRVKPDLSSDRPPAARGPAFGQSATLTRFGDRLVAAADGEAGAGGSSTGVGVLFVQGSGGATVEVISRSTRDFASSYLRSAAAKRLMGILASRSRGHGAVPVSSVSGGATQRSGGSRPRRRQSSKTEHKEGGGGGGSTTTGDSLSSARELLAEMEGLAEKAGVRKSRRTLPGVKGTRPRPSVSDTSHVEGGSTGQQGPESPLHSRSSLANARRAAQRGSGGATGPRAASKGRKPTGPAVTVMAAEAAAGGIPGLVVWQATTPPDEDESPAQRVAATLLPSACSPLVSEQPTLELPYTGSGTATAGGGSSSAEGGGSSALPPLATGRSISSVSSSLPVSAAVAVAANGSAIARWPAGGTAVKVTRDVVCTEQYVKTQVGKWLRAKKRPQASHKHADAGDASQGGSETDGATEGGGAEADVPPLEVEAALMERVTLFRIAAASRESNGRSSVVSVDGLGSGSLRLPGGRVVAMLHADGSGKEYDSKGGERAAWDASGRVQIPQGVRKEYATGQPAQRGSGGAGGVGAALSSGLRTIQWGACTRDVEGGPPTTTRRYLLGEGLGVQYNTVTRQLMVFFQCENIHHAFQLGHNAPVQWTPPNTAPAGMALDVFGEIAAAPAQPRKGGKRGASSPQKRQGGGEGTKKTPHAPEGGASPEGASRRSSSSASARSAGSVASAMAETHSDLDALMSRVARLTSADDAVEAAVKERASRGGSRASGGGASGNSKGGVPKPAGGASEGGAEATSNTSAKETDLGELMSRVARLTSADDAVEAAVKERASRGGSRASGEKAPADDDGASYATSAWEASDDGEA